MSDPFSRMESALVRILSRDGGGGTGFFVAPGLVVSCAHVTRSGVGSRIALYYLGKLLDGVIELQEPKEIADDQAFTSHPDISVIAIDPAIAHECLRLDPTSPEPQVRLHTRGFTKTLSQDPTEEPATFTYEGRHAVPGGWFLKLTAGEAVSGMSGGPLLDPVRGVVCGILKTSRQPSTDLGGWGIPISAVTDVLPDLLEMNHAATEYHARENAGIRAGGQSRHNLRLELAEWCSKESSRLRSRIASVPYLRDKLDPSRLNVEAHTRVGLRTKTHSAIHPYIPPAARSSRDGSPTFTYEEIVGENRKVVLLGDPGSGKSWVTALHAIRLADEAAELLNREDVEIDSVRIPIALRVDALQTTEREISLELPWLQSLRLMDH